MTTEHAHELFACAGADPLQFSGIKLLEINASADEPSCSDIARQYRRIK